MTTKSEFVQWRDSPITKELFQELNGVANGAASEILGSDMFNPERIQFLKGYIALISQVVGFTPEMTHED